MVAGFVFTSVLLVGCGTETVSGEAVGAPESASAGSGPFDGCVGIPDEALAAAGLDPTKKAPDEESGTLGWTICTVEGDGVYLMIAGTDMTLDGVRADSLTIDHRDVEVAGRLAVQHRRLYDTVEESCILAFGSAQGVTMLRLDAKLSNSDPGDLCLSLSDRAVGLVPYLPS
ncbi:DUF3558 family protein [Rhodococcus gannanensis]|uniref:DUF3558 family protein n=1 Tax=Rhodococcus gannanensis TaxID=1960308 RepID=A0ABW4NZU5_9NOCA